ncbi:hypothetical protein BGZ91_011043, partial [Linnemannia elongata]
MAPTAVSPHSFTRSVLAHLSSDTTQLPYSPSHPSQTTTAASLDSSLNAPPATSDDLVQTVATIDTEIQAIKAQVYKKLLANYGAFSEAFEYTLEIKDKIDDLLEQADNMASRTTDPEHCHQNGLRQTVMSALVEHHEISHRVQENNRIMEGLEHFSRVGDILSQYEAFMDSGKILEAGHCIQQAAKTLAHPPNAGVASSHITRSLTDQCARMTEAIDQMLDDLIANAIHYQHPTDDNNTQFKLTISYDIKVPPLALPRSSMNSAPGSIRWHALIRALTLLDVAREKLRPLQKFLIRH